jgi:hypothetical protein
MMQSLPQTTTGQTVYGRSGHTMTGVYAVRGIRTLQDDDTAPSGAEVWYVNIDISGGEDSILTGVITMKRLDGSTVLTQERTVYGYSNGGALPTCWHLL